MTREIRVLAPDDMARWKHVTMTAFMDTPESADRWAALMRPDWTLGAIVDGELQAFASSVPLELWLEGSRLDMGGVTSVACMPEYRRQGHVAELMRRTLARTRKRGQPLSSLWTPHPALYRRYGYEVCSDVVRFSFNPKRVTPEAAGRPPGRVERSGPDGWREFDTVYEAWGRSRNSLLARDETRWKTTWLDERSHTPYLYRNAAGRAEGYAVLTVPKGMERPERVLTVNELVALNGDAYRSLLGLVLGHDLVPTVRWFASPDEALLEIVDPEPIERATLLGLMLRIVDLPAALAGRPAYGEGSMAIHVADPECPWNAGTWQVSSDGGRLAATGTDRPPLLSLDPRALAQLFNGYRSATALARAGRITVHSPGALEAADALFAMRSAPFCADDF